MTTFERVEDDSGIDAVAALAHEIWNGHFVPIIGQAQVDYMLDKFQSARAIRAQIAGGYEYYLMVEGGDRAGYFALVPSSDEPTAQLSKIYVRSDRRGRGAGRAAVGFAEKLCADRGIVRLLLTVNVNNAGPIAFYMRMGFANAGSLVTDIGNGFVMDDYRMEKPVGIPLLPNVPIASTLHARRS